MSPSTSLLLLLLLASCVLAMPTDHLEASGLGPVEAEGDETVVVEAGDGNMATGDAAFASNFGSDDKGGVSTSFSVTASGSSAGSSFSANAATSGVVQTDGQVFVVDGVSAESAQIANPASFV
ncbi:uncharacterized protein LOC122372366 [Amphibalanus amphitrite]|uniref:uncharacterized protein LOC122372366 n=1 Tax=Amphibalanus amphitrite TaxID=1232801 RepID=UPI001C90D4E3|nr:uncharacterized protein LOC122372366 [Amphibalanus amphitrite]